LKFEKNKQLGVNPA